MIANILGYTDLLQAHIESLNPGFAVYAGKPVSDPSGVYCYISMAGNSEKLGDDSVGTLKKEAIFDFVIVSNDKSTPDVVMGEYINTLSNLLVTQAGNHVVLPNSTFLINSIQEGQQSGVLRDVNENPYVIVQYVIIYKYRYDNNPRI